MLRNSQENLKCVFEGNKYKYVIIAIYVLILLGFIGLNIIVYNKLVAKARDRFSAWGNIENNKNNMLMAAINNRLNGDQQTNDNTTPDIG
jgi:hypothetical protein